MDPNENLARQRQISREIDEITEAIADRWVRHEAGTLPIYEVDSSNLDDRLGIAELGEELSGLTDALHAWLSGGGVLPKEWQR